MQVGQTDVGRCRRGMVSRLVSLAFAVSAGFGAQSAAVAGDQFRILTVNYPLAYFATRIGGEYVDVVFPAPPDGDPANWSPDAEDVDAFRQADLVLLNGAGYASWIRNVTLPADKLLDTSAGFADRYIAEEAATHSHGEGAEHSHEPDTAFTTWLDPQLAIAQAAAIRDELIARRPDAAANFAAGYESLQADLLAIDQEFAALFAELGGAPVVFSHPVYQYLERRYDVNGISVHWEPEQMPDDEELLKLADRLMRHPAQLMIWEGEPVPDVVAELEAWAVDSVALDPCGNRPEHGDYVSVMRQNVANLRAAVAD